MTTSSTVRAATVSRVLAKGGYERSPSNNDRGYWVRQNGPGVWVWWVRGPSGSLMPKADMAAWLRLNEYTVVVNFGDSLTVTAGGAS